MAQGLDIKAFTNGVLSAWWQSALVGIVVASALLGLIGTLWGLIKAIRNHHAVCGKSNISSTFLERANITVGG
jgi:hypothetical protein